MRSINISNKENRDAQVILKSYTIKSNVIYVDSSSNEPDSVRVIKSHLNQAYDMLLQNADGDVEKLTEKIISEDPEIDIEVAGKFCENTSRVFLNSENKLVYSIKKTEEVYAPDGTLKEEREPKEFEANISEKIPINWTGKLMPKQKVYNKIVLEKKYQLKHINGLTYDFLYAMAKELHEANSLMMMGGGESGKDPLVLYDGGKPYRALLEGIVDEDKYALILHLSDMELKTPNNK